MTKLIVLTACQEFHCSIVRFIAGRFLRLGLLSRRHCGRRLIVEVGAIIRVPGELNAHFATFNPAQPARHYNILAIDQNAERRRYISEWNRRKPCAHHTHVFQFAKNTTAIIANQQADWLADLIARVRISPVFHNELIQQHYGSGELNTVYWDNKWFPHLQNPTALFNLIDLASFDIQFGSPDETIQANRVR